MHSVTPSVAFLRPKLIEPLAPCNFMVLKLGTFIILSIHSATVLFIQHVPPHNPSRLSLKCRSQMEGCKINIRKSGTHHSAAGNTNNQRERFKPDHPCLLTLSLNSRMPCPADVRYESRCLSPLNFPMPFKSLCWEKNRKQISQRDASCVCFGPCST